MMSGRNWSRVQTTCHWTTAKEVSNTVCLILVIKSLWRPWEDFFQTKMQIKDFGTDSFISSIWWGIAIWVGPKRLSGFQQYDDLSDDDAGSQGQPGCLLTVQRQKALPYLCVKTIHLCLLNSGKPGLIIISATSMFYTLVTIHLFHMSYLLQAQYERLCTLDFVDLSRLTHCFLDNISIIVVILRRNRRNTVN